MARIQMGGIVTDIRGKVGGTVFQNSASGLIMKNKSTPVNKLTTAQSDQRIALANTQATWQSLSDLRRSSWSHWAIYQNLSSGLFKKTVLSGQQAFNQINLYLSMIGENPVLDPIFSPYTLGPLDWSDVDITVNYIRLVAHSDALSNTYYLIPKLSLVMSPSRLSQPSNLKFCMPTILTSKIWDITDSYVKVFGQLPPITGSLWIEWFLIQKSNFTTSSLVSRCYDINGA